MTKEQLSSPAARPERTVPLVVRPEQIPRELLGYPQWVCWRYRDRGVNKKPDKQPVNPHNLHNAGVHWKNTWSTFEHAYTMFSADTGRGIQGIGFVLTQEDPFVGIDIDNCFIDDSIAPAVRGIVQHFGSYTEVSPSGRGLRILVACPGYAENTRTTALEVYAHARFLTLTGHQVDGTLAMISRVEREQIIAVFGQHTEVKGAAVTSHVGLWANDGAMMHVYAISHQTNKASHPDNNAKYQDNDGGNQGKNANNINADDFGRANNPQNHAKSADGHDLWPIIFAQDKYGAQHFQRFQGDISHDQGDHSLAVIRLLNCLARWTHCDAGTMREMILMSPLANEKWFSKRGKGDWLDHQIADAIRYMNTR